MASPANIAFAGTTDADGTASIPVQAPPTLFAVLTITAECDGNPNWVVTNSGRRLAFGNGPQVSLGPVLTSPGERLTIAISGAASSVQVTGNLAGTQHPTAEEAASNYKPMPNAVTVGIFSQARELLHFVVPAGAAVVTEQIAVPAGSVAIGFMIDGAEGDGGGPAEVQIVGDQSNLVLADFLFPYGASLFFGGPISTVDTTITVNVTERGASSSAIYVFAWQVPPATPFTVVATTADNGGFLQGVSEELANPAPWQAAKSTFGNQVGALAAGASGTLVTAVAAQKVYVHNLIADCSGASGGAGFSKISIRGSSNADNGTGVFLRGQDPAVQWTTNSSGAPTAAGDSLIVKNTDTVAHTIAVSGGYSQQ